MKRNLSLSAIVLALCPLMGCAVQGDGESRGDMDDIDTQHDAIVGGNVDTDHPSVVIVGADKGGDWCTGVLIGTRTVLTAGHCLLDYHNNLVSTLYVRFSYNGKKYYGTAIQDPEYSNKTQDHDVGIIKLNKRIKGVEPTPYSRSRANVGDKITVVAYGQTSPKGGMSKQRLRTEATIDQATDSYLRYKNPSNGYTCWGDSGAPDFLIRNGVEVVVGVDSTGPCKPDKNIWDPQVSNSSAFIDEASDGNAQSY